jgi:hypothetical protein
LKELLKLFETLLKTSCCFSRNLSVGSRCHQCVCCVFSSLPSQKGWTNRLWKTSFNGTLGGLFRSGEDFFAITAGHVILPSAERTEKELQIVNTSKPVYQPAPDDAEEYSMEARQFGDRAAVFNGKFRSITTVNLRSWHWFNQAESRWSVGQHSFCSSRGQILETILLLHKRNFQWLDGSPRSDRN